MVVDDRLKSQQAVLGDTGLDIGAPQQVAQLHVVFMLVQPVLGATYRADGVSEFQAQARANQIRLDVRRLLLENLFDQRTRVQKLSELVQRLHLVLDGLVAISVEFGQSPELADRPGVILLPEQAHGEQIARIGVVWRKFQQQIRQLDGLVEFPFPVKRENVLKMILARCRGRCAQTVTADRDDPEPGVFADRRHRQRMRGLRALGDGLVGPGFVACRLDFIFFDQRRITAAPVKIYAVTIGGDVERKRRVRILEQVDAKRLVQLGVADIHAVAPARRHRQRSRFLEIDRSAVFTRAGKRLVGLPVLVNPHPVIAVIRTGKHVQPILPVDIDGVVACHLVQRVCFDPDAGNLVAIPVQHVNQSERAAVCDVKIFPAIDRDRAHVDKQPLAVPAFLDFLEKQAVGRKYLDTVVAMIGDVVLVRMNEYVDRIVEAAG